MSDARLKVLTATALLLVLGLVTLMVGMHTGEAELNENVATSPENRDRSSVKTGDHLEQPTRTEKIKDGGQATTGCGTDPGLASQGQTGGDQVSNTATVASFVPRQAKALAHVTNYGDRFARDFYGQPINNQYIVVLHETVASAGSTIRFFQTPHYKDDQQFSYHTLITLDGTVVYLVPPEKRAFGAGNSVFEGSNGPETIKTNSNLPPSVNNFAYHVSLETPRDGNNNRGRHSGYTEAQYQSLAWLVAKTQVPNSRVTTHKAVDRSGDRFDPRSFNWQKFLGLLNSYPRPSQVTSKC